MVEEISGAVSKGQVSWSRINKVAYERTGKSYDVWRPLRLYGYLSKYFRKTLRKYLPNSASILDAGCGTGNSTFFLDRCVRKSKILGIDQAKKMVDVARTKRFRNEVSFEQRSIEDIYSEEENKFDAVQFFQVIHHFKDLRVVLSASERVLKEGGVIFFVDYFSRNPVVRFLNVFYTSFLGQGKYYNRTFSVAEK